MDRVKIPDYTELTCTNLMIKLKIITKKMIQAEQVEFYSTREQFDNIKKPFSKNHYSLLGNKTEENKYHAIIKKN